MIKQILPLRLILNTDCNGHCNYCHKEGCVVEKDMDINMIFECVNVAKELGIRHIALTGGEPTLRPDLSYIINEIQKKYVESKITLTSNGAKLMDCCTAISKSIYHLNLSITSLNPEIAFQFENVNPQMALSAFDAFPAESKNLNVVVVNENASEINDIIQYCILHKISLDLMFELKKYSHSDYIIQKNILENLEGLGNINISLKSIPVLEIEVNSDCKISVKHPALSAMQYFTICESCLQKEECYERICAVRVHPDALVTPCLNKCLVSQGDNLPVRIKAIYSQLWSSHSLFEFMFTN